MRKNFVLVALVTAPVALSGITPVYSAEPPPSTFVSSAVDKTLDPARFDFGACKSKAELDCIEKFELGKVINGKVKFFKGKETYHDADNYLEGVNPPTFGTNSIWVFATPGGKTELSTYSSRYSPNMDNVLLLTSNIQSPDRPGKYSVRITIRTSPLIPAFVTVTGKNTEWTYAEGPEKGKIRLSGEFTPLSFENFDKKGNVEIQTFKSFDLDVSHTFLGMGVESCKQFGYPVIFRDFLIEGYNIDSDGLTFNPQIALGKQRKSTFELRAPLEVMQCLLNAPKASSFKAEVYNNSGSKADVKSTTVIKDGTVFLRLKGKIQGAERILISPTS